MDSSGRMGSRSMPEFRIRPGVRSDADALVALVDGVYREYGDEVYLEGYDRDLLDVEESYRAKGGEFVVLEVDGQVRGAHATQPVDVERGIVTFRRLYLPPELRGTGAGKLLMDWAVEWSRQKGFHTVEFWSDTRFERAHRFFERYGFVRGGIRHLEDGPLSFSEHQFTMELGEGTVQGGESP